MIRKRYLVRFVKTVTDDSGQEHASPQAEIEVFAGSDVEAIEQAKAEFCLEANLQHWSAHADRYEICEMDYAS